MCCSRIRSEGVSECSLLFQASAVSDRSLNRSPVDEPGRIVPGNSASSCPCTCQSSFREVEVQESNTSHSSAVDKPDDICLESQHGGKVTMGIFQISGGEMQNGGVSIRGSHLNKPKNQFLKFGVYIIKMWKMDTTIPMSLCCAATERSQSSATGSLNVTKTTQNPLGGKQGFSLTSSLASASVQLNLLLQSESATR